MPASRVPPVIMLVEDNPADLRLTQEVFEEAAFEHRLLVARDGEQALAMLRGQPPHAGHDSYRIDDMPRLYSGCYGLGSRDLQPEALVAAIENMLPDGAHKPFYYLSVDFVHDTPANPKQEIYQQNLVDGAGLDPARDIPSCRMGPIA